MIGNICAVKHLQQGGGREGRTKSDLFWSANSLSRDKVADPPMLGSLLLEGIWSCSFLLGGGLGGDKLRWGLFYSWNSRNEQNTQSSHFLIISLFSNMNQGTMMNPEAPQVDDVKLLHAGRWRTSSSSSSAGQGNDGELVLRSSAAVHLVFGWIGGLWVTNTDVTVCSPKNPKQKQLHILCRVEC